MAIKCSVIEPKGKRWTQFIAIYQEAFPSKAADSPDMIADKVRSGRYTLIVAMKGHDVVGGAIVSYLAPVRAAYVAFTCTSLTLRSTGIGRAVVEAIRVWAAGVGGGPVPIFAEVHHGNKPEDKARVRFWRREGFRMVDVSWADSLKLMVNAGSWTPMELLPAVHEMFKVGYRHVEDYDAALRTMVRNIIRKPLETPLKTS